MTKKMYKSYLYKGLPVVDAPDDIEIDITKSDISHSSKRNPNACAAAKAVQRIFKTEAAVYISRTYIKDKKGKVWIRFLIPESISREITSFDRSGIFEPGNYTLKAPSKSAQLGNYTTSSNSKGSKAKKRQKPMHFTANVRESAKKENK